MQETYGGRKDPTAASARPETRREAAGTPAAKVAQASEVDEPSKPWSSYLLLRHQYLSEGDGDMVEREDGIAFGMRMCGWRTRICLLGLSIPSMPPKGMLTFQLPPHLSPH